MSKSKEIQYSDLKHDVMMQLASVVDQFNKQSVLKSGANKKAILVLMNAGSMNQQQTALNFISQLADVKIKTIDLSTLISQYIGETEKNLNILLSKVIKTTPVLFFDEADALFGKRTDVKDAHDKYANQEVSYLLSHFEEYPGIVVIATIKKVKPLSAIKKRFHSILEF